MYRLALRTLQKNFALYASYVVMFVLLEQAFEMSSGVSFVVGAILALYTHRMILLNENYRMGDLFKGQGPSGEKPPIFAFFFVSAVWLVVFLLLLAVFYVLLFVQLEVFEHKTRDETVAAMFVAMIPAVVAYGVLLSLFGTVLPAAAIRGDKNLKVALRRGRPSFWKTFRRLIAGPFAIGLFGSIIVFGLAMYLSNRGMDVEGALVRVPLAVFTYCMNFGGILMGVTALSMAYQSAETDMEYEATFR